MVSGRHQLDFGFYRAWSSQGGEIDSADLQVKHVDYGMAALIAKENIR